MKRKELIGGLIYLPIHIFIMPFAVSFTAIRLLSLIGILPSEATLTLIFYLISFLFVVFYMQGFLRNSFSDFIDKFFSAIQAALFGYILYMLMLYALSYIMMLFVPQTSANPNNEALFEQVSKNWQTIMVSSVLLAPIVEETLFRGVLFGLIRKKSRIAAYVVSFVFFSVYHLWTYALKGIDLNFIFYMLQYLPGSIVLARCYEKSGTIWSPIILHMIINSISIVQ